MSRLPRFTLPDVPQHIIQRGNNREPCFYAEEDYGRYRQVLTEAANKNKAIIHAYVLMTNHVHLLVTPQHKHSITHMMQDLGRKYVRYINHTYKRTGTLWPFPHIRVLHGIRTSCTSEGRYKASLVDSEAYLLTCMQYIELNPVRANMVAHPGEYRWSSYSCNANGKMDNLIQPHPLYMALDKETEQRLFAYRELFRNQLESDQIHAIRDALNQQLVLGRDDFKDKIEEMTNRQTRAKPLDRNRIEEDEADYYFI